MRFHSCFYVGVTKNNPSWLYIRRIVSTASESLIIFERYRQGDRKIKESTVVTVAIECCIPEQRIKQHHRVELFRFVACSFNNKKIQRWRIMLKLSWKSYDPRSELLPSLTKLLDNSDSSTIQQMFHSCSEEIEQNVDCDCRCVSKVFFPSSLNKY